MVRESRLFYFACKSVGADIGGATRFARQPPLKAVKPTNGKHLEGDRIRHLNLASLHPSWFLRMRRSHIYLLFSFLLCCMAVQYAQNSKDRIDTPE